MGTQYSNDYDMNNRAMSVLLIVIPHSANGENKKHTKNSNGKTSWKIATSKIMEEMGG